MTGFSEQELIRRAFKRVAFVMFEMWEEKGSSDTRLLMPPLIPDNFVMAGKSIAGTDHREHAVPRAIICEECHKRFREGVAAGVEKEKLIESAAELIQANLKIVLIAKKEQQYLDRGINLNLRQTMPKGWDFRDGDVYARLTAAGIKFTLTEKIGSL